MKFRLVEDFTKAEIESIIKDCISKLKDSGKFSSICDFNNISIGYFTSSHTLGMMCQDNSKVRNYTLKINDTNAAIAFTVETNENVYLENITYNLIINI